MCEYIDAQRQLWRILLTGGATNPMRQEFIRLSREFAETNLRASSRSH